MRIVRGLALALVPAAAAMLPGLGVTWEAVGAGRARLTRRRGGLARAAGAIAGGAGRPAFAMSRRGSGATPDRADRAQPFGGRMSEIREAGGCRLPFRGGATGLRGARAAP